MGNEGCSGRRNGLVTGGVSLEACEDALDWQSVSLSLGPVASWGEHSLLGSDRT